MAFPASGSESILHPTGSARDIIPITASATLNVFGNAYNAVNGGDARACLRLLASAAMTITCVTAQGTTRTAVPLAAGWNDLQVIQVTAISAGTLWAAV